MPLQVQEFIYYGKLQQGPEWLPLLRQVLMLTGSAPRHNPSILPASASVTTGPMPGAYPAAEDHIRA